MNIKIQIEIFLCNLFIT